MERLSQEDTPLLAARLLAGNFSVLVETNGSYDIDLIDRRCARVVDVKCPSSGESNSFYRENLGKLTTTVGFLPFLFTISGKYADKLPV